MARITRKTIRLMSAAVAIFTLGAAMSAEATGSGKRGGTTAGGATLGGTWGGDRAILTLTAGHGTFQMDCAYGTITGPLKFSGTNRFVSAGTFQADSAGPAVGDKGTSDATYEGRLQGDEMLLSIQVKGSREKLQLRLSRNRPQKLIRCL